MKVLHMYINSCSKCPLFKSEYLSRVGKKYGYKYISVCNHDGEYIELDPTKIDTIVPSWCPLEDDN